MANDQQGPNWKLEDDLETVTLTFRTDPVVVWTLKTNQVEEILKNLGEFRAAMKPPIPQKYEVVQKISAVPNPAWYTEPELMSGNTLLHMCDPRYGWLHYLIPTEDAQKLVDLLQAQIEEKQAGPKGPKN